MKYLFLDIDGVLNHELGHRSLVDDHVMTGGGHMSKRSIKYLTKFIKETNCEIIISSVWRSEGVELLKSYFAEMDFKYCDNIIDVTPNIPQALRGNEIRDWIKTNCSDIEHKNDYVIFDDDSDMLLWQASHYFKVDGSVGLTENICYRAKRFLDGDSV